MTLVTSNKEELIAFKKKYPNIITKAIDNAISLHEPKVGTIYAYTSEVNDEMVDELPDFFFPSLFQEKVDKKYEIRVFYLHGVCYSMAILSQNDETTQVDFRNYNKKRPNRNVPFKLPKEVDTKIDALMQALDFNSGSLDLIVDQQGKYIFLEVNPVGQYGMTSGPCNYHLDKKIAEKLISLSKHE